MRDTVATLLSSDTQLNSLGITSHSLFAGDVDTPAVRPYMVLRWGDTSVGVGDSRPRSLVLWVHDKANDYTRIDGIIRRARQILENTIATRTSVGWITAIDWVTDSGDLSDDVTHTILRTSAYAIVASGQ